MFDLCFSRHSSPAQSGKKVESGKPCERNLQSISLTTTLERLGDLGVFLVQSLASLFWEWVLVSVRSVMSGQDVDGSVQGTKGWLSGNLGESTVVRDKVDHFLFHVFTIVFHSVRSLC